MANESFYEEIPSFCDFSRGCDFDVYEDVPGDWDLVMAKVEGSGRAIAGGRYADVNAAGVSVIVAIRNALSSTDLPFAFRGDGAVLLTPSTRREEVFRALRGTRVICREAMELPMRMGVVPVQDLIDARGDLRVARFAASANVDVAMLRGRGVAAAEAWLDDSERGACLQVGEEGEALADLKGLWCRWRPAASQHGIVASVIVQALAEDEEQRAGTYRQVLAELAPLVQNIDGGRPICDENLQLHPEMDAESAEVRLRAGTDRIRRASLARKIRRQFRASKLGFFGRWSSGAFDLRAFRRETAQNTDYRRFLPALRLHLDVRRGQLERLKEVLQLAEDDGYLVYGIHTSGHSLVTSMVDSSRGRHIHFVDGAAGGYTLARRRMRARLAELEVANMR